MTGKDMYANRRAQFAKLLYERTRETLVAGSFMVIPKGQPHKVHCLEPGVVFVSYEGNPDITPIAEHDA